MWQDSTSRKIAQSATPKDLRRQFQGAVSRAQGNAFESTIEAACGYYFEHGLADIEKTPEPMQPTKDLGGGRFVAHYTKAAQADFKGTLRGGRSVNFEAKHTGSGKMEQSRVTEDQTRKLNNTESMGGLCFVLCSFGGQLFYRIPWTVWKNMKTHFGHKYITPEEAAPYRLRIGGPGVLLFLEGAQPQRNVARPGDTLEDILRSNCGLDAWSEVDGPEWAEAHERLVSLVEALGNLTSRNVYDIIQVLDQIDTQDGEI